MSCWECDWWKCKFFGVVLKYLGLQVLFLYIKGLYDLERRNKATQGYNSC